MSTLRANAIIDSGGGNTTTVNGVTIALSSQAQAEAGTDNTTLMTPLRVAQAARPVLGTSVASTSGTSIDFTGIPSWVKRVTVMLDGVSTSGTSGLMLQIGDSGGIETAGYASYVFTPTSLALQPSSGFALSHSSAAAILWSGIATVCNISGNTWCQSGNLGSSSGGWGGFSGGGKALSATLDRIRITTVGGTDTFDAGTVNIMWE